MAKEDANEQIKEVLRQIIQHRFWISIGFAALFAVIAYFVGSGPVSKAADEERKKIEGAKKGVEAYQSPTKPTEKYKPIVVEKTEIVEKDVNKAWRELYSRQAPLLTWPERVQERFRKWGRKWPETEDKGRVRVAIVDYMYAYPEYVDMVYKTVDPFDYETGKGIVAAPTKEELLQPAQFTVESMPSLGKVWSAQERLWIQRTVLEVIHQVNKNAKDWDSAIVKQINALLVATGAAQGQRSIADDEKLTKAPEILAPGETAPDESGGAGTGAAAPGATGDMPRRAAHDADDGDGRPARGQRHGRGPRRGAGRRLRQLHREGQVQDPPDHVHRPDRPGPRGGPARRAGEFADVDPGDGLRPGETVGAGDQAAEGRATRRHDGRHGRRHDDDDGHGRPDAGRVGHGRHGHSDAEPDVLPDGLHARWHGHGHGGHGTNGRHGHGHAGDGHRGPRHAQEG